MAAKPMNLVGTINILDRGDGPAQEVLSRTARNRAQRQQDETRNELNKITDRVDKTLGQFDLVNQAEEDAKNKPDSKVAYVNDLDELYSILSDPIAKRKYLQHATEIIVGYQDTCSRRFKLMQQVSEFLNDTSHRWEEEDLNPPTPEVDMENVQQNIVDSLDTAKELTGRIADLNKEMIGYMYQYANAKAGNKNRKKLEKALSQAKDDVQLMSEKLLAVSKELEEKDEKIQSLYRQVEVKAMEVQRFKTAAEIAKKSLQESAAKGDETDQKDREIRELNKKVEKLALELQQKEVSKESSQRELLSTGRENVLKIKELEDKLAVSDAKRQSELRDTNDFNEKQLVKMSNSHREEIQQLKTDYEKEIAAIKLDSEKQSAQLQTVSLKCQELDSLRDAVSEELNVTKASLEAQLVKEADLINEKEALLRKIADLIQLTPSVRSVSASSSQVSDALKSDIDKDVKGRGGIKKKSKGADSITDEEPAATELEPELAEVELPGDFEKEEKWSSYPMTQAQSAFAQYRQFTQQTVNSLKTKVFNFEKDAERKVKTLKAQFSEHKNKWYAERSLLIEKIELSQKQTMDAEKDADGVLNQLEEFVTEAEQLEKDEEANALKRQADAMAQRKPPTPSPVKEPTPASAETDEDLLQQTDDAKAELKSRDGQEQSAPNSRKGRRSVTFTDDVTNIRPSSSSRLSSFSDRHAVFERIIGNLRAMMSEESLDVVQRNALTSLRSSIKAGGEDSEAPELSLAMFSLASQISAESVYLGYKPDSLFSTILTMYYQAVDEYNAMLSKLATEASDGPTISDLTKLLAHEHEKSTVVGLPKSATPDHYSPQPEETDSVKFHLASAAGSYQPRTPTTVPSSSAGAQLEIDLPESGRSTPHSRLSSKYRASIEQARSSIAERRSTSPHVSVPEKASFEDAELDENAELPTLSRAHRSTSVGSSLFAEAEAKPASGEVSRSKTDMSERTAREKTPTTSAKTRATSSRTLYALSTPASVPRALEAQTPAISVYDKSTAVTPLHTTDRTTSYSAAREATPEPEEVIMANEYMKLYNAILAFKDGLAKVLLDKDMMSPSQVLSEIETKPIDAEQPVIPQMEQLGESCVSLLADCELVVQDALQAAFREDYNVSSVVSRATSYADEIRSRPNSYALAPNPPTSPTDKKSSSGLKRSSSHSVRNASADANVVELHEALQEVKGQLDAEVQSHQTDLNHHTAMVMELQDTVAELRRELALLKEQAEQKEAEQSDQESAIIFTRLDAERNAKNLKRALNNNKLTEDKYQAAVEKMDAYVSLPAKRFSELVKKYVHHKNMLRIENTIKNRHSLDDTDMDMLERMESLQNMRTKRWIDKMDELAERRADLASELMASLEELEQQSGIFMIKPMFSYRAFLSSSKHPKPQKSDELPSQRLGVPVLSQPEQPTADQASKESSQGRWASHTNKSAGKLSGGTWDLSASLPGGDNFDLNFINTPRILELDVNRMMYGQNQVSMKSNVQTSNDRLVNAANSSTRSYMTVRRPVASTNRPSSSGAAVTSKSMSALPDVPKRSDSAEAMITMRATPPLPPIARNNTLAPLSTADGLGTGRNSSVNPSRLARDFTDDSIHMLPSHVTKIVTNSKSLSREDLLAEEPSS